MKKELDKLYFGVVMYPLSYGNKEQAKTLTAYNLFSFARVQWAVASYASKTPEEKKKIKDPLFYCFSSVWSRCEFELVVCPWGGLGDDDKATEVGTKVDIYELYVKPNAEYLLSLVNSVSPSSAKAYLREWKKTHRWEAPTL